MFTVSACITCCLLPHSRVWCIPGLWIVRNWNVGTAVLNTCPRLISSFSNWGQLLFAPAVFAPFIDSFYGPSLVLTFIYYGGFFSPLVYGSSTMDSLMLYGPSLMCGFQLWPGHLAEHVGIWLVPALLIGLPYDVFVGAFNGMGALTCNHGLNQRVACTIFCASVSCCTYATCALHVNSKQVSVLFYCGSLYNQQVSHRTVWVYARSRFKPSRFNAWFPRISKANTSWSCVYCQSDSIVHRKQIHL